MLYNIYKNILLNFSIYKIHLNFYLDSIFDENCSTYNLIFFDFLFYNSSLHFKLYKNLIKKFVFTNFFLFNKFMNKFDIISNFSTNLKKYYFKITIIFEKLIKICKIIKRNYSIITEINNNYINYILKDNLKHINKNNYTITNKNYNKNIYSTNIYLHSKKIDKILLNNYLLDIDTKINIIKNKENKNSYTKKINVKKNIKTLNLLCNDISFYNINKNSFDIVNMFYKKAKKLIFGQNKNLIQISNKLLKLKNNKCNRPISSWLLCGPSGTGKTEISKILSNYISKNKKNLIHLDMSEYMESHSISRLIGSPPGYIGSTESSSFITDMINNPESIILFDEIEKANKNIYSIFLQILDEGILTDSQGITVFFNKSIVIFTSNLGSDIFKFSLNEKIVNEENEISIKNSIKDHFRPEFINRLDDILIFNPLYTDSLYLVIEKLIKDNFYINIKSQIKSLLSLISYSPSKGSRFVLNNVNKLTSIPFDSVNNTNLEYNKLIKCNIM